MATRIETEWLARTMAACCAEDEETKRAAWNAFAAAIWPSIMNIAIYEQRRSWAETYSWVIAEDAAIYAFMRLMEHVGEVSPEKLFGWVKAVVRNNIKGLRVSGFYAREQTLVVDSSWDVITRDAHRDESAALSVIERLRLEIKRLHKDDRELLYAYYWLGMTHEAIGTELGISRTSVLSRLKTVHKKLHRALTEAGYDSDAGATTDNG